MWSHPLETLREIIEYAEEAIKVPAQESNKKAKVQAEASSSTLPFSSILPSSVQVDSSAHQRLRPLFFPNRDDFDFDGYVTDLPFLRAKYITKCSVAPDLELLYREILVWQAKPDKSFSFSLSTCGGELDCP